MDSQICLGIDLGTTNSTIMMFTTSKQEDNPMVVSDMGENYTPSIVAFTNGGGFIVGKSAKIYYDYPEEISHVIYQAKKLIGRTFEDYYVQSLFNILTYKIVNSKQDDSSKSKLKIQIKFNKPEGESKIEFEPEQISSFVLGHLYEMAKQRSKNNTDKVVITVPANFNEAQRRSTKDAAKIAGLDPIAVISEPIASCISYAFDKGYNYFKGKKETVFVFDFGGGTLDLAIVEIEDCNFTVKATIGDSNFGGSNIDEYLFEYYQKEIEGKYSTYNFFDETKNKKAIQNRSRLISSVEEAKIAVCKSKIDENPLIVGLLYEDEQGIQQELKYENTISKSIVNQFFDNHTQAFNLIDVLMKDFPQYNNKIDTIIFAGGSSQISYLRERVCEILSKSDQAKLNQVNITTAIAKGAAIYGAFFLQAQDKAAIPDINSKGFPKIQITDVTPLSVGIASRNPPFDIHIPRNSPIPTEGPWIRYIAPSYKLLSKRVITLQVYEGESQNIYENHKVANFDIVIPDGLQEKIYVCARIIYNNDGIMVEAILGENPNDPDKETNTLRVNNDLNIHTPEEMTKYKNIYQTYLNPDQQEYTGPSIDELFVVTLNSLRLFILKSQNLKTPKSKISSFFNNLKKEIPKGLDKERALKIVGDFENKIKCDILPTYERPKDLLEGW